MTPTEMMLLAAHRTPAIPLEAIARQHLGMEPENAARLAALNRLPFPTFRVRDSCKAPHMVLITDLAAHIDSRHAEAVKTWEKSQV